MMILPELPTIVRARGFRLYDRYGNRYIDFFQNGGRAILGHRPPNLSTTVKNVLSKGLTAEYPSIYELRLIKSLHKLLPQYPGVRIYENRDSLINILRNAGILPEGTELPDCLPLKGERNTSTEAVLWRPFLESEGIVFPGVVVPLLPFPGKFVPAVLCFKDPKLEKLLPPSALCSPLLLAGLTRIVYDLMKEIAERDIGEWGTFVVDGWERKGPYLLPVHKNGGEYGELYNELLEAGIVVNPHFPGPSIIPGEYSQGEVKKLFRR